MLFTGKGDDGTTSLFGSCSGERLSKISPTFEALGSVDELNSWLGICKVQAEKIKIKGFDIRDIIHNIQESLFIVQAELGGAKHSLTKQKIVELESLIKDIEHELPVIGSFFIPGASELGSLLDYARSLSRRVERSVLKSEHKVSDPTKAYLNRLSSILYALARLVNHKLGKAEDKPNYK